MLRRLSRDRSGGQAMSSRSSGSSSETARRGAGISMSCVASTALAGVRHRHRRSLGRLDRARPAPRFDVLGAFRLGAGAEPERPPHVQPGRRDEVFVERAQFAVVGAAEREPGAFDGRGLGRGIGSAAGLAAQASSGGADPTPRRTARSRRRPTRADSGDRQARPPVESGRRRWARPWRRRAARTRPPRGAARCSTPPRSRAASRCGATPARARSARGPARRGGAPPPGRRSGRWPRPRPAFRPGRGAKRAEES
jgi:hypothetical protein